MFERSRHRSLREESEDAEARRAAAESAADVAIAQAMLVTGAAASLERLAERSRSSARSDVLSTLAALAPAVGGVAAAATRLSTTDAGDDLSDPYLRAANGAVVLIGGTLFVADAVRSKRPPRLLGSVAFAWIGILGFALDRQRRDARVVERQLRRRASVVERIVPRRRPKLDRVVVHV